MIKLIKYIGNKTYMYPNGKLATPDKILIDYPAILTFTHVIEVDENEQVISAVMNLSQLRSLYNINRELSEEAAIIEIENIINNPPIVEIEPTAEERIAAALEFNNLLNMPM